MQLSAKDGGSRMLSRSAGAFRVFTILFAILTLTAPALHAAEEEEKDEYDFTWLDPEKKISVVQNRKYTKARRFELALGGGIGIGDSYRTVRQFMPRASYYFNESWGVSALGAFVSNSENNTWINLKLANSSALPNVREVRNFIGGSAVWVPFYAKLNIFNRIVYMDWHFEAGVAQVNSQIDLNFSANAAPNLFESSHTGFFWGTAQKFWITREFAARVDFHGLIYSAPKGDRGAITNVSETNFQYYLTLGASYSF